MPKTSKRTKRKSNKLSIKPVLLEATCTASFTCLLDIVTTYSAGVSGYAKTILASDFTGLNTFQALFLYYTPKRTQANFTLRASGDNGTLARFRVLDPLIDAAFTSSVTEPIALASDPTSMQCIANKVNNTKVFPYKNRKMRFTTVSATSDKLGAVWVTLPVAQDPSGTCTTVITVHLVVTFYRKASQQAGS